MDDKANGVRNLYITTNYSCNLNCSYCYEDKTSTDTCDIELTKKILSECLNDDINIPWIINFHGGEPFIVFDKIKEICEWTWSNSFKQRYLFFVTSNGTLVHGRIKEWLNKNRKRFYVGLSLDGNKYMQDLNRSNSFDKIDIDYFVDNWPNQGVKMTISPDTIGCISDGIKFMHSRGINSILANLAYMVTWNIKKVVPEYRRELRKLTSFYLKNPNVPVSSILNVNLLHVLENNDNIKQWCGAGTSIKAYDINGECYPCHLFFESVCGKRKAEASKSIDFTSSLEYIDEKCRECPILSICPTCYGSNYIENGFIGERNRAHCELTKVQIKEVCRFEYLKIKNDRRAMSIIPDEEKFEKVRKLQAIEKIYAYL